MLRRKKVNELYYARDNNPSFYQFKQNYHFTDSSDRQYMIAVKNRQVFQNAKFQNNSRRAATQELREPVMTNSGFVKLYVKLTDPTSKWFGHSDMNHSFFLYGKKRDGPYLVVLKIQEKHNVKRRTGAIYVKGLSREVLLTLLNT